MCLERLKMNNFNLIVEDMLSSWDNFGVDGFDSDKIDELEKAILEAERGMSSGGIIEDSIYDTLVGILKALRPESNILRELWEDDGDITDYTELLRVNPMQSIETCKSYTCDEINNFLKRMPDEPTDYFASYKINGHGIRVVYLDGELVSATSRARASAGRDLTRQMRVILGDRNDNLDGLGLVEIRGELCLKENKLETARMYNPTIKSAFSAVSSMARDSASEGEIALLDFLAYGLLMKDCSFETREEEFSQLTGYGFQTPEFTYVEDVDGDNLLDIIKSVVEAFEENYEEFGYFCDGVVFEVNNRDLFRELGSEGKYNLGNIALKVGVWKQDLYTGYINHIEWTRGKNKLSPVAIIEDDEGNGVLTAQGNRVRRVPLYEPRNIIILDAYAGMPLCFKYGGEAGVVPCFPDGRLLSEEAVKEILVG